MKGPIIGVILVPIITYAMYAAAIETQAGAVHEFHGKNAAIKSLIYSAGGTLGTTGSLVVGGVLSLAMLAWLILSIKNKKRQTAE